MSSSRYPSRERQRTQSLRSLENDNRTVSDRCELQKLTCHAKILDEAKSPALHLGVWGDANSAEPDHGAENNYGTSRSGRKFPPNIRSRHRNRIGPRGRGGLLFNQRRGRLFQSADLTR